MRYSKLIQSRTIALRAQAFTYAEIKRTLKLSIPKSTLSYWCSGVKLPKSYEEKVKHLNKDNLSKAQKMAWLVNKRKQELRIDQIYAKNKHLTSYLKDKNILKMILSFLHLGEGSKRTAHRGLRLGNSDPNVIKLYIGLLNKCYGIQPKNLKCYLSYRADQKLSTLQRYWSRVTTIPLKNFYITSPDPRTAGKPTLKKDYRGVCVVSCPGADIQLELEAIPKIILGV